MKKLIAKTMDVTKQAVEKVEIMVNKTIDNIDQELGKKSVLSKDGISDGKVTGYSRMTIEEFLDFVKGDIVKLGLSSMFTALTATVEFCPTHRLWEVKLQHNIKHYCIYSKKLNRTYILIIDNGFLNIYESRDKGIVIRYDGLMRVEDFINSDLSKKIYMKLYNEYEEKIKKAA